MKHFIGSDWRNIWDLVVVSADKPNFYTDNSKPFREVSVCSGRLEFTEVSIVLCLETINLKHVNLISLCCCLQSIKHKIIQVTQLDPGNVYAEGCAKELARRAKWCINDGHAKHTIQQDSLPNSPSVLFLGDSLFADLVDAKREFGWTTAAIVPELGLEVELQDNTNNKISRQSIDVLLHTLRQVQTVLGTNQYNEADLILLDELEICVSKWRDEQTKQYKNPFGSIFRARFQPSLFAHSLRRFCDLYVTDAEAFGDFSPQHRFYPEDSRLLGHEK